MAKFYLKEKAEKLRTQGYTIREIASKLFLSKSTVSVWCREIKLTDEQLKVLMKRSNLKNLRGRLIGAETNKQKRIQAIKEGIVFGQKYIKKLNKKEILIAAAALYWAEGSKSYRTFGFQFVNSDPEMILCMKKFLQQIGIDDEDICCTIQINLIHKVRIEKVLKFWKKLLGLQDHQVANPSFVKTAVHKVYENYDNYFGICRLRVRKSALLKYKTLGLIEALKESILSR